MHMDQFKDTPGCHGHESFTAAPVEQVRQELQELRAQAQKQKKAARVGYPGVDRSVSFVCWTAHCSSPWMD